MWEKFVRQLEAHPYIFGGVALGVVILIFWGGSGGSSGSSTSAISAAESQAIADSAQANASLQLSNDQVQMNAQNDNAAVTINGQNTSTAQAINDANTAATVQAAQIAASANSYNDDTAVKLAGVQAGSQGDLEQAILSSQNSAQDWITNLETNVKKYQLPNSIQVSGLSALFSPQTASAPAWKPFGGYISGATLDHSNSTSGAAGGSEGQAA